MRNVIVKCLIALSTLAIIAMAAGLLFLVYVAKFFILLRYRNSIRGHAL